MLLTSDVLAAVSAECKNQAGLVKHWEKGAWLRLADYAHYIAQHRLCPSRGVSVLGPFLTQNVQFPAQGEIVSFRRGIKVYSTLPRLLGKEHVEHKERKVRVADVTAGFVNVGGNLEIVNPMVHWDLNGGYRAWTSVSSIQSGGLSIDYGSAAPASGNA